MTRRNVKKLKTIFWVSSVLITIFISFYLHTGASVFERILGMPLIFGMVVASILITGFALGVIVVICEWVLQIYKKIEDWLSR